MNIANSALHIITIGRLRIHSNSRLLFVTTMVTAVMACPVIAVSFGPIGITTALSAAFILDPKKALY